MKKFRWEQDQISNMKEYIARFGHGSAKLARQAQSKEKTLDKMVRGGLTEKVQSDHVVRLRFIDVGKLPPPVLQFADVTFGYSPERVLYRNVRSISPTSFSVCLHKHTTCDALMYNRTLVYCRCTAAMHRCD